MGRILGLVIAVSAMAGVAHAQSGDAKTLAEQLFNQARDLVKANRWGEACPKFEASLRYDPVLGTRLNLAACYEHIGKLASAWALYRESINLARKAGDVKRHEYAQKQSVALEPRLPKLTISAPVKLPADFVVTRDGTPIDAGALGVALYVDPGAHEIAASAPGFEPFTLTITLVEGKAEATTIPDLKVTSGLRYGQLKSPIKDHIATTESMVDPSPTPKSETIPSTGMFTRRRKISIGLSGASVIGVSAGMVLGTSARSKQNDAFKLCSDLATPCAQADQSNALLKSARSRAFQANVAFGIAAAAAIGAAVSWFIGAPNSESPRRVSVVPSVMPREASVVVMGRF